MATETISASGTIGLGDRWLYKAGGIFAAVVGLLLIIDLVLYVIAGKLPSSGAAWLPYINGKTGIWWAIIWVTLISDLLFLMVNLSLYAALRTVHKGLVLIATVWSSLCLVLDEAVNNTSVSSLLTLGGRYTTGTAAQRAADAAAANYGAAIMGSKLDAIYLAGIPAVTLALISIVMLRSPFGKRLAYLGIAAAVFGAISVSGWGLPVLLSTVLEAAWLMLVGRCLYFRYGAQAPLVAAEIPEEAISV